MDAASHVVLSAQVALERRMETIARNVANLGTVGYRADGVSFKAVLDGAGADSMARVAAGETYITRHAGRLSRTENRLDVAVQGDGWFAINTPSGVAYTRDGRMQITENGDLVTLNGYAVLDVGRAPIAIDPAGGDPIIARDGMITQQGQQIGAIGLFRIDDRAPLTRLDNSAVRPDGPVTEILDFTTDGVLQGFVEESNVNPVIEMSRLIMVARSFDSASSTIQAASERAQSAIKILGETS